MDKKEQKKKEEPAVGGIDVTANSATGIDTGISTNFGEARDLGATGHVGTGRAMEDEDNEIDAREEE